MMFELEVPSQEPKCPMSARNSQTQKLLSWRKDESAWQSNFKQAGLIPPKPNSFDQNSDSSSDCSCEETITSPHSHNPFLRSHNAKLPYQYMVFMHHFNSFSGLEQRFKDATAEMEKMYYKQL